MREILVKPSSLLQTFLRNPVPRFPMFFGLCMVREFLKNVVGRVPWVELDRAGWAGLVQNSPNDEHKEALVLLAASEDLINCVIVVVTNFIIDIIEDVDEVVYPTKDTFHWETIFK